MSAALGTAAKRRMSDFNSQDLANAAWAFARASQGDVSIFAALATAAEQRMGDFNSQELANRRLNAARRLHEPEHWKRAFACFRSRCTEVGMIKTTSLNLHLYYRQHETLHVSIIWENVSNVKIL